MINFTPVIDADEDRTPREQKTRTIESRTPLTFVPAGLLPEFNKDPDYVYRWVRVSTLGKSDNPNVANRLRQGWVPVKAEDHPEIVGSIIAEGIVLDQNSRFPGLIEQGGLLLCKASKEVVAARRRYFAEKARSQIEAVDNNFMRENNPRMPLFRERRTEVKSTGE